MPLKSLMLLVLLLSIVLLRIYFWILPKDSLMLLMLEAKYSIELWSKITLKLLFQNSESRAWLMLYRSCILNMFLFSMPQLLKVSWVFSIYCSLVLEGRSGALLTWWGKLLRVVYLCFSWRLSDITTRSSLTMLLLLCWTLVVYSSLYLLKNMDKALKLCILEIIVWPLISL